MSPPVHSTAHSIISSSLHTSSAQHEPKIPSPVFSNEVLPPSEDVDSSTFGDYELVEESWPTRASLFINDGQPSYFEDVVCNSSQPCDFSLLGNDTLIGYQNATNQSHLATGDDEDFSDLLFMGVTSIILGLVILITVIGNVFVIAAILLERNLQNVANYLIVSLAVADLMVACLVMPLGAVAEVSRGWILGPELCDMWTSSDVLCCTASILHLVAIAVDRYWAVTNVDYIHTRNGSRIVIMIVVVWSVALVVSLAPQFGLKDPQYMQRITNKECLVSQDVAYQIFATCSTFYVPLLVILVLYWKIFQTARKRIHRRRQQKSTAPPPSSTNNNPTSKIANSASRFITKRRFRRKSSKKSSAAEALVSSLVLVEGQSTASADGIPEEDQKSSDVSGTSGGELIKDKVSVDETSVTVVTTAFTISKSVDEEAQNEHQSSLDPQSQTMLTVSNNVSPEKISTPTNTNNGSASHQSHISDMSRAEILQKENAVNNKDASKMKPTAANNTRRDKKESIEAKRERKAAKTLAIITGAFVVCWLPFFIMALWMALCGLSCNFNKYIASFFLWLGYFNSTLNPVIYTIFSPEFRQAFKRILCGSGRTRQRNFRPGKL